MARVRRKLAKNQRSHSPHSTATQRAMPLDDGTPTTPVTLAMIQALIPLGLRAAIGTVSSYLTVVGTFFRWRSNGKHAPTEGVALPDPGERDVEPWGDDKITALREAANTLDAERSTEGRTGPRLTLTSYRLLLELALATGCRVAELGALE